MHELKCAPKLNPMMAESPDPALLASPKFLCTQQSQEAAPQEKPCLGIHERNEAELLYRRPIPNDCEVRIIYVVYLPESQPVFVFSNSRSDFYGYRCKEIRREIGNLENAGRCRQSGNSAQWCKLLDIANVVVVQCRQGWWYIL